MKLPAVAALGLLASLLLSGCGRKIQSDLELENAKFSVNESAKAQFAGTVKNTGTSTYSGIFIVVDGYEGEEYVTRIQTSADLFNGRKLGPGETTSFSKEFEDGGAKPNRYEVVKLYGIG